jgi:hypothetical protein
MLFNQKGKVYQYDLNGNFIAEYESLAIARDLTGINNISPLLNGLRNMSSAGGFIWTRTYYIKLPKDILLKYEDRKFKKYDVPIYEYDLEGNLLNEYLSLSQVSKNKAERNSISAALNGKTKICKNKIYKLEKYKKLPKSILKQHEQWSGAIVQYSLSGKKIQEYKSTYEAWKILKISRANITRCLKQQQPQANGFIWKYKK